MFLRYEQAKNISQDLEKQAARVHEEAKRAGDKAVEIYASVAQLTPVDSEALEVCVQRLATVVPDAPVPLVWVRACPASPFQTSSWLTDKGKFYFNYTNVT